MSDPQSTEPSNQKTALRRRRHWLGLPICEPVEGTVNDVLEALPHLGRQPFAMVSPNGNDIGVNPFLDMVYKVAAGQRSEISEDLEWRSQVPELIHKLAARG